MKSKFPYVSSFRDRHGKLRWRFRRKGFASQYFKAPNGSREFEKEYIEFMNAEQPSIGSGRIKPGSVSDVIARYYVDNKFQDLRPSTQVVYKGVLERFRAKFGDDPMRAFDASRIARLMNAMRDKPHAAARLRKLLTLLFKIARREKIVPGTFDPVKDTSAPKVDDTGGYHRWTEDELAKFEAKHPFGTKPRLAFSLLLFSAQRSGDVRMLTHDVTRGGRIPLNQSKTSSAVDVPIVEPLKLAIAAGPTGTKYLLENNRGEPFTAKGFYNLVKRACIVADLAHCSAHGLRKSAARRCKEAGCDDSEGMAITGHKTVREYRRYAGDSGNAARADSGMSKVMANRSE
jgi:integrase